MKCSLRVFGWSHLRCEKCQRGANNCFGNRTLISKTRFSLLQLPHVKTMAEEREIGVHLLVRDQNGNFRASPKNDGRRNLYCRSSRRNLTLDQRFAVFKTTNGVCYLCQSKLRFDGPNWHIDHVICISADRNNNDTLGNVLPACAECNLQKSDHNLIDIVREE